MDHQLHNRLVSLVLELPGSDDYQTRSGLLAGISVSLTRSSSNAYTDISGLVTQLEKIQLRDGQWALRIFVENAIARVPDTTTGQQLVKLYAEIEEASSQQSTPSAEFPHGYAVIAGIAKYRDSQLKLSEAIIKDVMDMHTTLTDHCGYTREHVHLCYDSDAKASTLRSDLQWLAEVTAADEKATALFYFSGHGERITIDGKSSHYLIPYDCNLDDLEGTAIGNVEFAQLLHAIRAPRLLVLLDGCYAGGFDEVKGKGTGQGIFRYETRQEAQAYYDQLAQGEGRVILASSRSTETSRASSALNNSLFTHYLVEGLRGKAHTQGDGLIRVRDLSNYIEKQVAKHEAQRPVMTASHAENFPIALYQGGKRSENSIV
ncbi:MAG TPA: caspase family protein [Ktedonobacteraceae bacterium]|nr:caspase family protein [Ktedonobacteraceae bacterium]